jgi:ssDNA-binding Zn-finger/Zn-ribbon topoisomerase 1
MKLNGNFIEEAKMKCPKCGKTMNEGFEDLLNYGLTKPVWFCSDYKKCNYKMERTK